MALLLLRHIASLFLIIALGWGLVRLRVLKIEDSHVLSLVTIYAIAPCAIVNSFQIELTESVFHGFLLALGAAVLFQLVLLCVSFFCGRILHFNPVERASLVYTNAGNLIFALVSAMLGDEWVVYASAFMCLQTVFLWTHGRALLSGEKKLHWKELLRNVNLIAIVVGLVLMLARIRLPAVLLQPVSTLGAMLGPVSMLLTGMLLSGADWKRILRQKQTYLIALLRLILIPLLILILIKATGLATWIPEGRTVMYISFMALMAPSATMVMQLSELYHNHPEYASAINTMTTLLCILTMPLMTALYTYFI